MIPIMPDEESQKLSEQNAQWDRELDSMTEENWDRFCFNCTGRHLGDPIPSGGLGGSFYLGELYGYAVRPEQAPQTTWSQVLDANLVRSRRRIESGGLFDPSLVEIVQTEVMATRGESTRSRLHPFCMIPRQRT
jgi:hypothetical protein